MRGNHGFICNIPHTDNLKKLKGQCVSHKLAPSLLKGEVTCSKYTYPNWTCSNGLWRGLHFAISLCSWPSLLRFWNSGAGAAFELRSLEIKDTSGRTAGA